MAKKVFIISVLFIILIGVAVGAMLFTYASADFNVICEIPGIYGTNGKFLFSDDTAYIYRPLSLGFEKTEKKETDLSLYGFDETVSYFVFDGVMYTENEGLWSVSSENKFVYTDADGKSFVIDTERKASYPVFDGSVVKTDKYGAGVLAFSDNGIFAAKLEGDTLLGFRSDDDPKSMKISEITSVPLSEFGTDFEFIAFVNQTQCILSCKKDRKTRYIAADLSKKVAVYTALDEKGEYISNIDRFHVEREVPDTAEEIVISWADVVFGKTYDVGFSKNEFSSAGFVCVSPNGDYAVIKAVKKDGGEEFFVACRDEKCRSLSGFFEEDKIVSVSFCLDNVLAAGVLRGEEKVTYACKICFGEI